MKKILLYLNLGNLGVALALNLIVSRGGPAQVTPSASIVNDEGGVTRIVGQGNWSSLEIPIQYDRPVIVLLDRGATWVERDSSYFASKAGQIFGEMTSGIWSSPFTYTLDLPLVPQGQLYDVEPNGKRDRGVQIWAVTLANNAISTPNEPFLSPVEQLTQLSVPICSVVTAPPRNLEGIAEPIGGTLIVYAPTAGQRFPSGFGADETLFTADDPLVALPQGYTVVRLDRRGFQFDRSREVYIPLVERPEDGKTDFSALGYTAAFNALIDVLKARYAYTELRGIDWERWRRTYWPEMEVAEKRRDAVAYFAVLDAIAQSMRDAHVQVFGPPELLSPLLKAPLAAKSASVGIEGVELSDGRVLVQSVVPKSPAERVGILPLTEIVAVNGIPLRDRLVQLSQTSSQATPETRRLDAIARSLQFAAGERVMLRYRNADGELEEKTLTAAVFLRDETKPLYRTYPTSRLLASSGGQTYGYVRWTSFRDSEETITRFTRFLEDLKERNSAGLVIDLRENGGGSVALLVSLLSYFWSPESPLLLDRTLSERMDLSTGNAIAYSSFEIPPKFPIYAPTPDLYYEGSVAILVSEKCLSACEFFADWMQRYGRATVIGAHSTGGAGGSVVWVPLPEDSIFTYTSTRELDQQGKPYIEGRGMQPAIQVPITEAFVRAVSEGKDPVLDTALDYLQSVNSKQETVNRRQ